MFIKNENWREARDEVTKEILLREHLLWARLLDLAFTDSILLYFSNLCRAMQASSISSVTSQHWFSQATHDLLHELLTGQLLPSNRKNSPKGGLIGRGGSFAKLTHMCQS